jgi:hypothetical protein
MKMPVEYSSQSVISLILFFSLVLVVVILLPIITGVTLGIPNSQLKYSIQGTLIQTADGVRAPSN